MDKLKDVLETTDTALSVYLSKIFTSIPFFQTSGRLCMALPQQRRVHDSHTTGGASLEISCVILWLLHVIIIVLLREIQYLRKRLASFERVETGFKPVSTVS
ncbi:MAG TPA: hypothetical protein VI727_09185 [Candidatus Brocadiaceae bacterium]|nr:hypothetical protein [Candidatus Brocadiaceae bacterium]